MSVLHLLKAFLISNLQPGTLLDQNVQTNSYARNRESSPVIDMDRFEQRRLNLMKLRDERCGGKASVLASRLRRAPSYVSRMLYPEGKPGKKRIADHMIELLEQTFALPLGWLDRTHDTVTGFDIVEPPNRDQKVTVPRFQFINRARALLLLGQPGIIVAWLVSPEWVKGNIRNYTSIDNLAIVTGFGDSTDGMFNAGDPILVDCGITSVDVDAIYFFRVGNEGFIKRIQRIPGMGLVVLSVNWAYSDWIITADMDFEVFDRVIKVWQSREF
jgi:hypothetical protein